MENLFFITERQGGKKAKLFNIAITCFHIFLFAGEGVGGVPIAVPLVNPVLTKRQVVEMLNWPAGVVGDPAAAA
jgi:hypothetical protein